MSVQVSKFRVAIYGVVIENGTVLMTETKVPGGTYMNFPGGGLELGEEPIEALAREFQEETGLAIVVKELLYASQRFQQNPDYPTEQLMHLYYRVERASGVLLKSGNNDDVLGTSWVKPGNLSSLRIAPVDAEFIESQVFASLFLAES